MGLNKLALAGVCLTVFAAAAPGSPRAALSRCESRCRGEMLRDETRKRTSPCRILE